MTKRRKFKNKVAEAIERGDYTMMSVWPGLNEEDREALIAWITNFSDYKDVHAGLICLMNVKTIISIIEKCERTPRYTGYASTINQYRQSVIERIRSKIKNAVKRDIRRKEYIAYQYARERHTA